MINGGMVSLFFGCFLAATIIPLFSESLVLASILAGYDPFLVMVVATAGNWSGGITNYVLGLLGNEYIFKKWLRMNPERLESFGGKINRHGHWLSLIVWLPVIGDPLTVAMGIFRVTFWKFALISLFARAMRYYLLIFFLKHLWFD